MKQVMHEPEQPSRAFRHEGMDWLVSIEETRPGHVRDRFRQRGLALAPVKFVVTVPKRFPFRKIALLDVSHQDLIGHGFSLVNVATKFGSQVLPPLSEKDCSKRCESGVMSDQTMRTRMVLPLN